MAHDSRHFWYAVDILLYLAAIGLLMAYAVVAIDSISWMTFVALGLATYRMGDIISCEEVTSVIREPFAGYHNGFRGAVSKSIECPSCSGTWCGLILLACVVLFPKAGLIPVYALAFSACERIISRVINVLATQSK